ncbi:MAG: universal stress protein, partial [Actinomycetia bacterium]|nr:universal stress protein [Actinomycetes bacterium]
MWGPGPVGVEVEFAAGESDPGGDVWEPDRLLDERRFAVEPGWIEPAVELGARVRSIVGQGDARQVLLSTAEAENANLVVVGRTGAGGGPGFLHLGSAVEYVSHHMSIPLAVVPGDSSRGIGRIVVGVDG